MAGTVEAGTHVELALRRTLSGSGRYTGRLIGADPTIVEIETDTGRVIIPFDNVAYVYVPKPEVNDGPPAG